MAMRLAQGTWCELYSTLIDSFVRPLTMPTCPQCSHRPFITAAALMDHMRSSSLPHPYCKLCDRRFIDELSLKSHQAAKHPPMFDCMDCGRPFKSQVSLDEHFRGSPNHPNCPVCGRGFRTQALADSHHNESHPRATCDTCRRTMYEHEMEKHFKESPRHPKCHSCDEGFANDADYTSHCSIVHSDAHCVECDRQFFDVDALQNHYANSLQHPKCMRCKTGFANENEYAAHVATHSPVSPAVNSPMPSPHGMFSPALTGPVAPRLVASTLNSPALSRSDQNPATPYRSALLSAKSPLSPIFNFNNNDLLKHTLPLWSPVRGTVSPIREAEDEDDILTSSSAALMVQKLVDDVPEPLLPHIQVDHVPDLPRLQTFGLSRSTSQSHTPKYDPFGENLVSEYSPDVSSPAGLAQIPTISPVASTPSTASVKNNQSPEALIFSPFKMVSDHHSLGSKSNSSHGGRTPVSPSSAAPGSGLNSSGGPGGSYSLPSSSPSSISGEKESLSSSPSLHLHCRLCGTNPCRDTTATMCGHIFCNNCIVHAVISTSSCPVCNNPTLLYCLFKLDLTSV
ncbi:uncharacterized protein EV420DRAFT_1592140 [Desarmillaria tabescens]|uniref:RING-type domain-containing protein n=1 Tax=Armillaria tabescens TaxID=1929756 RepID=A0AA39J467_ARMTA|nr:uncharacterized protein EV420DRAFT_1592140 [Desarmillaria tabescens]KAK0435820.1 hypothetical protein EV420DRAFT_1592140 [Desarmillaria tabescens]